MMTFTQRRILQLFLALGAVHSVLFLLLPTTFSEFNDRVNWFAINAIPWWPLYKMGLPVTRYGWLVMPNWLGWIWCAAVWMLFYASVAKLIVALASRYGKRM